MNLHGVVIVRDEALNLDALFSAPVWGWIVVDTGSTDGTPELIEARGITVHRRPWVNFGVNRSEALALARGTADWLLALDADMTVEWDEDFVPDPAVEAYMLRMGSEDFTYRLPLLLRGDLPWESRGAVHEYTTLPDRPYIAVPTDQVRIRMHGPDRSSPDKSRWHAAMLEEDLARNPDNARTVFYLAQTYRDLGRLDEARELYERRVMMGGWAEEVFYARYRAATLEPDEQRRWAKLMAAWESRPQRLEPLHALTRELNASGLHHAAYRLLEPPNSECEDVLFVHRDVWRWGIPFEKSIAAWWVGERDTCRGLSETLLKIDIPPHIRTAVERNLMFC